MILLSKTKSDWVSQDPFSIATAYSEEPKLKSYLRSQKVLQSCPPPGSGIFFLGGVGTEEERSGMGKLPYFPFYPNDWLSDLNLKRCSHASKGVYIDILCLMHSSEERGVLISKGEPWNDEDIAGAIGGDSRVVLEAITELLRKGVVTRREDGAILSRRVVRDECVRQARSKAGKKGGSKSATYRNLLKQKSKQNSIKLQANTQAKLKQNPEYEYENENGFKGFKEKGDWGKNHQGDYPPSWMGFYRLYPGRKSLKRDFERLCKHQDWEVQLDLLKPGLDRELRYRDARVEAGVFVEPWKHLSTWINNRCWEDEYPEVVEQQSNREPLTGTDRIMRMYEEMESQETKRESDRSQAGGEP